MNNSSLEETIKTFSGKNFSDFKNNLSQVLVDKINPISQEIQKLLSDTSYLAQILSKGSEKEDEIASQKIKKIHQIVGF